MALADDQEGESVARHPWVAEADNGMRWGVQLVLGDEGLGRLLGVGQRIEALGFDGCFIFDHPAVQADPWICLSALASVTERVRLGSLVNCVPYRHPAYLARLAADLDNISRGRLMLGLGIGWLKPEFEAFGVSYDPPVARFAALEEALEIIPGVWGPEKFAYTGTYYAMGPLQITPPPVQQPRPPLLIGGGGEKRSLRLVARYADACNISNNGPTEKGVERVGGPELIAHKLDVIRGYCVEYGRPYDEILRTHFTLRLVLAETEQALAAKIAASAEAVSGSPGTRRALPSAFVTGTPERVAAEYQALADVGIQYFTVQVDSGDTETLELLANEVVPRVTLAA
jgi:alkanesulfonate monooxygenase SsuD/methylene tetrahydromethanopterin reductase-like flavin-dependent oxidoreductase (luciferase family)